MGFLKGLGIGGGAAGAAGGGGNFLAKLFGTSPDNMSSIANRIGIGANQIAQAGGAEAGYQSNMQQPQMYSNEGLNNFLSQLLGRKQQSQQPGQVPQNLSWYGAGNG